jgi:hypothetical protein
MDRSFRRLAKPTPIYSAQRSTAERIVGISSIKLSRPSSLLTGRRCLQNRLRQGCIVRSTKGPLSVKPTCAAPPPDERRSSASPTNLKLTAAALPAKGGVAARIWVGLLNSLTTSTSRCYNSAVRQSR